MEVTAASTKGKELPVLIIH